MADELEEKIEALKAGGSEDAEPAEGLNDTLDDAQDAGEGDEPNREKDSGQVKATAERATDIGGGQSAAVWSAREYAEKELGIAAANQRFTSEEEFTKALAAEWRREAEENRQQKQQLEWYRQQAAVQQQQPAPAPKEEKPAKLFDVPEFDPRWEGMVEFNERGRAIAGTNGDPTIAAKYNAHKDYLTQFYSKFAADPEATLAPVIEARAKKIVEEALGKNLDPRLEEHRNALHADQFVRDNSNWLHQYDASGQVVYDQRSGKPALSYAGGRFSQHLHAAPQAGVTNYQAQIQYAASMAELDVLRMERQQTQTKANAGSTNDKTKQAALERGNRKPNRAGSVASNGSKPAAEQNEKLSLREKLMADFEAAGVTAADFERAA